MKVSIAAKNSIMKFRPHQRSLQQIVSDSSSCSICDSTRMVDSGTYSERYQESSSKTLAHSGRVRHALSIRKDLMNDDVSDLLNYPVSEGIIDASSLLLSDSMSTADSSSTHMHQKVSNLQIVLSSNRILKIFIDLLSPHISNLIYAIQSKANYFEWDGKAVMTKIMSLYSDGSNARMTLSGEAENSILTNTIKSYILKKSKKLELEARNANTKRRVIRNELFCNSGSFDEHNGSADYLHLSYLMDRVALVDEGIAFSDVSEELINNHRVYDRKCHSLRRKITDLCESIENELKVMSALQTEEIARLHSDFLDIITDREGYSREECIVRSHSEVVRIAASSAAAVGAALEVRGRAARRSIETFYQHGICADLERLRAECAAAEGAQKVHVFGAPPTVTDPLGDVERAAMQAASQESLLQFQRFLCDILKRSSKTAMQFVEDKYTEV